VGYDPTYAYNDGYLQYELDRSPANGFGGIKTLPGDTSTAKLSGVVTFAFGIIRKKTVITRPSLFSSASNTPMIIPLKHK
jgi:hypothetical protein